MISYNEALSIVLNAIQPLGVEEVQLLDAVNRIAAEDLSAKVNAPSVSGSLRDGFAVRAQDISFINEKTYPQFKIVGDVGAGGFWRGTVEEGECIRILTGAPLPNGADWIIAEEFVNEVDGRIILKTQDLYKDNILPKGSDILLGDRLISEGSKLAPAAIGLIAAAGYKTLPVYKKLTAAILATGDEVIAPGEDLKDGQLYASNLITLASWCIHYGFDVKTCVVEDNAIMIKNRLLSFLDKYDVVITSGGAWNSERDLVVKIMDDIGWVKHFHRVKIGPGKAIAFGMYGNRPVFCLPGGPPSNYTAFLELALVGILQLAGYHEPYLPMQSMQLSQTLEGMGEWTQFKYGFLDQSLSIPIFKPFNSTSRLKMMAKAEAVVKIPEGVTQIKAGKVVKGQVLKCVY